MNRQLFEDARNQVLVIDHPDVAAMKLRKEGTGWRGPCPLCNASKTRYDSGNKYAGAFSVDATGRRWRCYGCSDRQADVIDLEHRLHSKADETSYNAVLRLLGMADRLPANRTAINAPLTANQADKKAKFIRETAVNLWREGRQSAGTYVETYLRARGFHGLVLDNALKMLRYHPAAYHSGAGANTKTAPAMIGLIMTPYGATGGVSVTYLAKDGSGKSHLSPSRKVFGPERLKTDDGQFHYGGVWLAPPNSPGQLIVGEGIETVGSGAILFGGPARPVATLGLQALQGLWMTDDLGQIDLSDLKPAPDCRPFTWPIPETHPWDGPIICIDRDMSPIEVRVASENGPVKRELDSTMRAAICATLAAAAWLDTGVSGCAFALPPSDMDLNDQLRAAHAGVASGKLHISMLEQIEAQLTDVLT